MTREWPALGWARQGLAPTWSPTDMFLLVLRFAPIAVVVTSMLTGCAAGTFAGRNATTDVDLFQHLVADLDSVPLAWEEHWPPTLPVLIDYRTLATGPHQSHPDSAFITVPDNVTRARISAIQRAGLDTASTPPWKSCPGILLPDVGRDGCPASARVIYAFGDTLRPRSTSPGDATVREWVVIVRRSYLRPNGS